MHEELRKQVIEDCREMDEEEFVQQYSILLGRDVAILVYEAHIDGYEQGAYWHSSA